MASRLYAFKDRLGMYFVYNSIKTSLIGISYNPSNPDYSKWGDVDELQDLTPDQLLMVGNMNLCIKSFIEEDEYNVIVDSYRVLQTNDISHFMLKGYKTINSIDIDGSDTCKVFLSFDGRKNWVYYDKTLTHEDGSAGVWVKAPLKHLYLKGMDVSFVKTLAERDFRKIFTKCCTLDYSISIDTDQYVKTVNLNLPPNTAPYINNVKILNNNGNTSASVHKDIITLYAEINDFDGDDLTYEVSFQNMNDKRGQSGTIITKNIGAVLNYNDVPINIDIDPNDLFFGDNVITITVRDNFDGKESNSTIHIIKTNNRPYIAVNYHKGMLSGSITDNDMDDKCQYRITINNGDPITTEDGETIIPVTEWANLAPSVYNFKFIIPPEWIKLGEMNTYKIEYRDDVSDPDIDEATGTFPGEYYGLLFIDPKEDLVTPEGEFNKYKYYSDSFAKMIKYLTMKNVVVTKSSNIYEVGIVNNTEYSNISKIMLKSDLLTDSYKLLLSETRNPFEGRETLTLYNLREDQPQLFYVRLESYDMTAGRIEGVVQSTDQIPTRNA